MRALRAYWPRWLAPQRTRCALIIPTTRGVPSHVKLASLLPLPTDLHEAEMNQIFLCCADRAPREHL